MKREDVSIEYEELAEFVITEDFSVLYSKTKDIWFIEDYSEDGRITILEDKAQNILFEPDFMYKEVLITVEELEKFKEITRAD